MTNSDAFGAFQQTPLLGHTGHPFPELRTELPEDADRRILIVDDEAQVRQMFAEFLRDNYECTTAASADEALAILASKPYALVISDVMMPGRNGVELLREITSRYQETAVIMVSEPSIT
jgi:DNA-binding NtrC family response regulator